jgi:hypothetical protein
VLRVEVDTPNAGGPHRGIHPIPRSTSKVKYPHLINLGERLLEYPPPLGPCARIERCRARGIEQASSEGLYVHSRTVHNLSHNDSNLTTKVSRPIRGCIRSRSPTIVAARSGDIDPRDGTLTIRLDPLPTWRATTAIAELCQHLTATHTRYPGTNRILRYEVKNHP